MASESRASRDLDEAIDRRWNERTAQLEQIRKRMRVSWRNDKDILNTYFASCVINWKAYSGPKTEQIIARVYGIYRQAMFGDCQEELKYDPVSLQGKKWMEWDRLKGTPKETAKRRFITYLAEIDPLLIDVMPNEMPPDGFPLDRKGHKICAKCNTVVGCARPLMDQNKIVLRRQLFEVEDLHDTYRLKEWTQNALEHQRCMWGVHKPITAAEAKPFTSWFSRDENGGFLPYDSSNVMLMIKDLVTFHYEIAYDMQQHKTEYSIDEINTQVIKVMNLSKYYSDLTGENFIFEAPCTRDSDVCNKRREKDGGENHKHPVELEPPSVDYSPYTEAIQLRKKCVSLGLDPTTGVQTDINKRCDIYRERIEAYYIRQKKAAEAKVKNKLRLKQHLEEKKKVKENAANLMIQQMIQACSDNNIEKIMHLCNRGYNPNVETVRGVTPVLCLMMNNGSVDQMEKLLKFGVDINVNNRFGITPLMLACRMKDVRMIHCLMQHGADEVHSEGRRGKGRIALHYCTIHNSEEEAKVIVDYVKEGGDDALRLIRFLDCPDANGDTPLMTAASVRNGIMCHLLLSLGANPGVRNARKQSAAYIARHCGWSELADWLDKKIGTGVAKVETLSDVQFNKVHRYAAMQAKELLQNFGKIFLNLLQGKSTFSLLGSPTTTKNYASVHGELGVNKQNSLTNKYLYYIIYGKHDNNNEANESIKKLFEFVTSLVNILRQGDCYPNVECPPKPFAWTPLLCATALGDVRSIRLMVREGADPNYCNYFGTTPLMLAAQLNHIEIISELLLLGADIDIVDNEGYTALAYATSLPLAGPLKKSDVNILLNGDNELAKRVTSEELLKYAISASATEVKELVQQSLQSISPAELEIQLKHMQLLEKNGLSRIECIQNVHEHAAALKWRLDDGGDDSNNKIFKSHSEMTEEEAREHKEYEDAMAYRKKLKEDKAKYEAELEEQRCPMCTLMIPCPHFARIESVRAYRKKKANGEIVRSFTAKRVNTSNKTAKYFEKLGQSVLEEAKINRKIDRNAEFYEYYGKKIKEVKALEDQSMEEADNKDSLAIESADSMMEDNHPESVIMDGEGSAENKGNNTHTEAEHAETSESTPHLKSLLKIDHKKKYKPKRRVIRFLIDETVLPGGVDENDTETIVISNYDDAILSPDAAILYEIANKENEIQLQIDNKQNTNITSSSDNIVLAPQKNGLLSKEQEIIAINSFSSGKLQKYASDFTMKIGENPVKSKNRGIFMYDKISLRDEEKDESTENDADGTKPLQDTLTKTKDALMSIKVSGWIFTGVFSIQKGTKPIDTLNITLSNWSQTIEYITRTVLDEWIPKGLCIGTVIDVHKWIAKYSRCEACSFGLVRLKPDKNTNSKELKLCFPCQFRKSFYGRVTLSLPRSTRKILLTEWPFQTGHKHIHETPITMTTDMEVNPRVLVKQSSSGSDISSSLGSPRVIPVFMVPKDRPKTDISVTSFLGSEASTISNSTVLSDLSFKTLSTQSSNPNLDEEKHGPRDLVMLPHMIAKGNYDMAENILRIAISKPDFHEDEGILYLSNLIHLQAEMYKIQGYWVLALGLLMDAVDWKITRLGFDHSSTIQGYTVVASCLRSMGWVNQADTYMKSIINELNGHMQNDRKSEIVAMILEDNNTQIEKERVMNRVVTEINSNYPKRSLWSRVYFSFGLGGLCRVMKACTGPGIAARISFIRYCKHDHPETFGEMVTFVEKCFALHNCRHAELCHNIMYAMVQKYGSKHTKDKNIVSEIFNESTSKILKAEAASFLKYGSHIDSSVFDSTLRICLSKLCEIFRIFLATESGIIARTEFLDCEAELFYMNAVFIQNAWRKYAAKRRVNSILEEIKETKKKGKKKKN